MMSNGARTAGLIIGGLVLLAGLAIHLATAHGYGLLIVGLLVIGSVLFERRYRGRASAADPLDDRWSPTAERFIDSESGVPMEVWVDSLTGERCYQPVTGAVDKQV